MRIGLFIVVAMAMCGTAHARTLTAPQAPVAMIDLASASSLAPDLVEFAPASAEAAITPPKIFRGARLQCAVYARERSGVDLHGLARSWWNLAKGHYDRTQAPTVGAVLVLGGTSKGHVAVVSKVISATQILVDHANWMNHGEIQLGALMQDVSGRGDWSAVRVWYPPIDGLGTKAYPVVGFILPGAHA